MPTVDGVGEAVWDKEFSGDPWLTREVISPKYNPEIKRFLGYRTGAAA
jgi:hypothetical protein